MRVTRDALAVERPLWMIGDSAFDILNWHDPLLEEQVVPVALYNHRNTDDPLDIEYRVEDRVTDRFDDIGVSQTQLDETYADRSQVENTINVCKEAVSGACPPETRTLRRHTCSYRCVFGLS